MGFILPVAVNLCFAFGNQLPWSKLKNHIRYWYAFDAAAWYYQNFKHIIDSNLKHTSFLFIFSAILALYESLTNKLLQDQTCPSTLAH